MAFDSINPPVIDSMERAVSRLLIQFQNSPVILDVLQAFILEIQELQDVLGDIIKLRGPKDATNAQLEGIARIVGQDKVIYDFTENYWFAPDIFGQAVDQGQVWVDNAPLLDFLKVDINDDTFRKLIEAKVFRNFTRYGSVPEIQQAALLFSEWNISFITVGMMEVVVVVNIYTPKHVISDFVRFRDTLVVDNATTLPYPETLRITGIMYITDDFFAPDIVGREVDVAKVAVTASLLS